jgi:hypothetical protein
MRHKVGAWMREMLRNVWVSIHCVITGLGALLLLAMVANSVIRVAQLPAPWSVAVMDQSCAQDITLREYLALPAVSRFLVALVPADWICGPAPVTAAPDAESPGASQPDPVALERLAQATTPGAFVALSQHIHRQVEAAAAQNPHLVSADLRHVGTVVALCLEREVRAHRTPAEAVARCTPLLAVEGSH